MENLTIYAATYNVGTSSPDQSLENLLSVVCNCKDTMKFPDFYILSFQEVKAQPQNLLMDFLFTDDPWTHHCRNILKTKHFIKLKSIRLQGLLLVLFGQRKHLLNIRDLESEYTRTGLAGMWGNKGAVSIRFNIYGCSICFVNSHLSAHDSQLKDRIDDYNSIIKDQEFHVEETKQILFHDYVFWMGDLNFRLSEEYERTPEEIEQLINKNELKTLFEHDQLRSVMKRNEAFSELTEADPDFAPTFKFDVGTMNYNYKRRPAWCDRILYCVNSNNYENVTLKVNQLSYKSHPEYTLSDHKPVSAEFVIKTGNRSVEKDSQKLSVGQVFSDYSENVIEFDKISSWSSDDENKVIYKRTQEFPVTKEDWIGLYKSNFDSLDEYVTYEYVSKCSSPIMDEKSGKSSETVDANRPTKYELTFSELPSHCKGEYCLIYFSQTEDKVSSVLGISNNFNIVKEDSE